VFPPPASVKKGVLPGFLALGLLFGLPASHPAVAASLGNPTIVILEFGAFAETPFFIENRSNYFPFRLPDRTCQGDVSCRWTEDETKLHIKVFASGDRRIRRITLQVNGGMTEILYESAEGSAVVRTAVMPRKGGIRVFCNPSGEPALPGEQEDIAVIRAVESGDHPEEASQAYETAVTIAYRFRCLKQ